MRILSLSILMATLLGLPAWISAQDYSDPSVATPLNDGGYYALPQPAVNSEVQPGTPAKPKARPNGSEAASPSDSIPVPPAVPPMDPVQKGGLVDRLEAAERQIDALQKHVMEPSCGCIETCCDKSMTYAGLEIVALKVFQSEGNYGNNDYQPGVRIWAGVQRSDGLGVRVRWFDYTQNIGGEVVDIENLDLELTDAFSLGRWDGIVSGGLRYTEFQGDAGINGDFDVDVFATGLTMGLQLNRYVTDRASIFASVQQSILYGNDIVNPIDDMVFSITELQLGVQVNRNLCSGATAFLRTGVEADMYTGVSDFDSENVGLFGIFTTVGVMR